jgi:Kef-type K+ transport system membrane component KefB
MDPYIFVIAASLLIIVSHLFGVVAKKTNIPSVLLLIALGIGLHYVLEGFFQFRLEEELRQALPVLGIVGLIMIVLEAALDLQLKKEKSRLIWTSFIVALLALIGSALAVAGVIYYFFINNFYVAMIYATPLAIISSAIVLPSVSGVSEHKKEFMIYEATFSDILGIMLFYFLIDGKSDASFMSVATQVLGSVVFTVLVSIAIGIALVWIIQRIHSKVKLLMLISVLLLLYATGKKMGLSSLLIILIFGLMLSNSQLIFRGRLKSLIKPNVMQGVLHEMHLITGETSFVVRTFFFIVFGMTIDITALFDPYVGTISAIIIVLLYAVRFIFLRMFEGRNIKLISMVAPRGLITVLLFYAILESGNEAVAYYAGRFKIGVLFFVILVSSLIMMFSLISGERKEAEKLPDSAPNPPDGLDSTSGSAELPQQS